MKLQKNIVNNADKKVVFEKSNKTHSKNIEDFKPQLVFSYSSLGGGSLQNGMQKGKNLDNPSINKSKTLLSYSSSIFCDTRGEVSLWRAVITQAIIDSVNTSKRGDRKKAKESALNWFDMANENFLLVCKFAEMCPDEVIVKSLAAIKSCNKWKRNLSKEEKTNYFNNQMEQQCSNDVRKKTYYKTAEERDNELFSYYEEAWC